MDALMYLSMVGLGIWWLHLHRTHRYRAKLFTQIVLLSLKDKAAGRDYEWRFDEFSKVSFGDMAFRPWRDFDTFWPDKRFLEENPKRKGGNRDK